MIKTTDMEIRTPGSEQHLGYRRLMAACINQAVKDLNSKKLGDAFEAAIFLDVCGQEYLEALDLQVEHPLAAAVRGVSRDVDNNSPNCSPENNQDNTRPN